MSVYVTFTYIQSRTTSLLCPCYTESGRVSYFTFVYAHLSKTKIPAESKSKVRAKKIRPTRSTFVYSNYLYVNDWSMCIRVVCFSEVMQCNVMQSNAMSCKVMQCHANSCKVMQCMQDKKAGWVTHLLGQLYSSLATFGLYSGFFRRLERKWLFTTRHVVDKR